MPRWICVNLLVLFSLSAASPEQDDRQKAVALWEQAVAAKGGRERLTSITSFAVHEKTEFSNRRLREFAGGRVHQIVCTLPDDWWEFVDYRPGLMGHSITVANARTGLGSISFGGSARPFLRPYIGLAQRMRQLQYVYFLETRAVQPIPLRASRVRHGFEQVDRVETVVEDDRVVFDLDVKTHLPVRIEAAHTLQLKLDAYHDVGGITVPGRVTRSGDTAEARVEINPRYDPSIFTTPPSPDATVDSWRPSR